MIQQQFQETVSFLAVVIVSILFVIFISFSSSSSFFTILFMGGTASSLSSSSEQIQTGNPNDPRMSQRGTFALGCFWGSEHWFKKQFGTKISDVQVGYVGGSVTNPSYRQVCSGTTGHAEAVTFKYNPSEVSYAELLTFFFRVHNPTTLNKQGNDKGTQYRSAVFFHSSEQKELADRMIADFNTAGSELNGKLRKAHGGDAQVTTTVEDGTNQQFWTAEDYHQNYLEENPGGYCNHRIYF